MITPHNFMNRINKKKLPKYRRRALDQWKEENSVAACFERGPTPHFVVWITPIEDGNYHWADSERKVLRQLAEATGLPMPPL